MTPTLPAPKSTQGTLDQCSGRGVLGFALSHAQHPKSACVMLLRWVKPESLECIILCRA
jgi:hypothetical protein